MSPAKLLAGEREPIAFPDIKPFDGGLKLFSTLALATSYNPLVDDEGARAAELARALGGLDGGAKSASHAKRVAAPNTWSQLGATPLTRARGGADDSDGDAGSGGDDDDRGVADDARGQGRGDARERRLRRASASDSDESADEDDLAAALASARGAESFR
jgi:hypothetical protein